MNDNVPKHVTLRDIAKETGYTINTVSRALMGMPDISVATTQMIRRKAAEMGYVRNQMASALRSGRTRTFALIVGDLINTYFAIMFEGVEQAAYRHGYNVLLLCAYEQADRELQAIQTAISQHVEGIILFPCGENEASVSLLESSGIPFVLLARELKTPHPEINYVLCEEEQGGYLATRHMIEAGHRKLVYVYDSDAIYSINLRKEGFYRAVHEAEIPQRDIRVIQNLDARGKTDAERTAKKIASLRKDGFDGVVVFCDMEAWSIIASLKAYGLSVPDDLGIIGYDNIDKFSPSPAPLCSIDGKYTEMCQTAVALLEQRINGDYVPPQRKVFPVDVVCRRSCGIC